MIDTFGALILSQLALSIRLSVPARLNCSLFKQKTTFQTKKQLFNAVPRAL